MTAELIRGFDRAEAAYEARMPREPTAAEEAAAEREDLGELVEPLCEACGDQAVCPECVGT